MCYLNTDFQLGVIQKVICRAGAGGSLKSELKQTGGGGEGGGVKPICTFAHVKKMPDF